MSSSPPVPAAGASSSASSASPSAPIAKIYQHGDWEFAWQSGGIAPSPVVDAYETLLQIKTPEILFSANFLRMRHNPTGLTFAFDAKHALAELKASYAGWGKAGDRTLVPPLSPSAAAAAAAPEDAGRPAYTSSSSPLPPPAPVQVVVAPLWARRVLTGPSPTPAAAGVATAAASDAGGASTPSMASDLTSCCASTASFVAASGSVLGPASSAPAPRPANAAATSTATATGTGAGAGTDADAGAGAGDDGIGIKIAKVGPGATTLGPDGKPPMSIRTAFTIRQPHSSASTTASSTVTTTSASTDAASVAVKVTAASPADSDSPEHSLNQQQQQDQQDTLAPVTAPSAPTTIASRDPRFAFDWTYSTPYAGHVVRWTPLVPRPAAEEAHSHHGGAHSHHGAHSHEHGEKCGEGATCSHSGHKSAGEAATDKAPEASDATKPSEATQPSAVSPAPESAPAPAPAAGAGAGAGTGAGAGASAGTVPHWHPAPPGQTIPYSHLSRREPIVFSASLPLFEDELHDHGASRLSLKLRVMPTCFFLLLRCFVRVDGVLVRSRETRYFHFFRSNVVVREARHLEASVAELGAAGQPVEMGAYVVEDEAVGRLPEKARVTQLIPLIAEGAGGGAGEGKREGKEAVPEVVIR